METTSLIYTREQLLSRYKKFSSPTGLSEHTSIYSPQCMSPESLKIPSQLSQAVTPIVRAKRSISELADKPRMPKSTVNTTPPGKVTTQSSGPWPQDIASLTGRFDSLEAWAASAPRRLLRTTSAAENRDYVQWNKSCVQNIDESDISKAVVRWSDGRPLFYVAFKELLPFVEDLRQEFKAAMQSTGTNPDTPESRRAWEPYEAHVADCYRELVRLKRLRLPEPINQALRITHDTSVALWPSFRELFLQTENELTALQAWDEAKCVPIWVDDRQSADSFSNNALNLTWEYMDPQMTVQGPFTSAKMSDWFTRAYFPANLLVKHSGMSDFVPLNALYPDESRKTYIPFITMPIKYPPEREVAIDVTDSIHPTTKLTYQYKQSQPIKHREKFMNPFISSTESRPKLSESKKVDEHKTVQDLEKKNIYKSKDEERRSAQVRDVRREEHMRRVETAIRESVEAAKLQQLRKEKEKRERCAREAELKAARNTALASQQYTIPLVPTRKWKVVPKMPPHTVVDVGPSLEESRNQTTVKGVIANEWSKRNVTGKKQFKGKRQTLHEMITHNEGPARSPWQTNKTNCVPLETPWADEPPLATAEPMKKIDVVSVESPVERKSNEPRIITEVQQVPEETKIDIKEIARNYGIQLDTDFMNLLISMPDCDSVISLLADNLPDTPELAVTKFAEAFWDLVRNPFRPVKNPSRNR